MNQEGSLMLSDHYDGNRFFNPWGVNINKGLWDLLKWRFTSSAKTWPPAPLHNRGRAELVTGTHQASVHVTYLGHATVYIQARGEEGQRNILTDPYFSDRASPVSFAGPLRSRPPALQIAELPALDTVVVSHNHYDHLDLPSLKNLKDRFDPLFIVPLKNAKTLQAAGISKVIELDWWQEHEGVRLVPAQHWSARGIGDRNQALWGGYVFELPSGAGLKKVFFAGDTGYGPHFRDIHDRLGAVDLALLPIGAYEPRWFMKDQHMNPDDAVRAHIDLRSRQSLAIHFETLQLTDEGFEEPREALALALRTHLIPESVFRAPEGGETLILH
ncbi:MAG: hypothetical protein RJB38_467 [Pseudomonadota bacterium]